MLSLLSAGLERLQRGGVDSLLLDLNLPDSEGLETFRTASANARRTPMVVLTHVDDESLAATTLQQGAQDYLVKREVNQNWPSRSIQNAISRRKLAVLPRVKILHLLPLKIEFSKLFFPARGCS